MFVPLLPNPNEKIKAFVEDCAHAMSIVDAHAGQGKMKEMQKFWEKEIVSPTDGPMT
ncbi:MAG: hypothetical protein ACXWIN_00345 [Burkholderiaceae bacterium]